MAEKKSLVRAREEAQRLSIQNPDHTYWVMDKPRQRAVCHGSEWCVKERILAGWYVDCKYRNGKYIMVL